MPLLLTLFVGIAEFGRAYSTEATLSQAARQGVRVLALGGSEAAARTAAQQAAGDLDLTTAEITVSPGVCTSPTMTVTVQATRRQTFLTGFFGSAITLTGSGAMRCTA
jgi:Flp pilus assembly protein TadG